jgi:hypothetical protein
MGALKRYWPVLAVVAVLAVVIGVGALGGGDDDETESAAAPETSSEATTDGPPALAAFDGEDPLAAPDCDPETGRIMVPSLYAPDCVPLWDDSRDNGGATYRGVTADEIKVVVYVAQGNEELEAGVEDAVGRELTSAEESRANREKVFEAFNALWETYGRTVVFERLEASGGPTDDAAAKADAIRAAEEMGAFAVFGGPAQTRAFAEELVARNVICIGCAEGYPAESYQEWAPYVWGGSISSTYRNDFTIDLLESLAGKPAEFAGEDLQSTERKFALVRGDTIDDAYKPAADALIAGLGDAGIEISDHPYVFDIGTAQETANTLVARLQSDGVTSVVSSGDPFMLYFLSIAATQQSWYPEWILTGSIGPDLAIAGRSYDQDQWKHAFGVSSLLARVDPEATDTEVDNPVSWYFGEDLSNYPNIVECTALFNGIHLAGPDLTPETFRDALFSWTPTGDYVTGWAVSYGDRVWDTPDYTAADDVTLVWWDPEAEGPHEADVEGKGMYRYVDGGRRFDRGELDGYEATWFDEAGTTLLLPERPASDVPPSYPRRTSREG